MKPINFPQSNKVLIEPKNSDEPCDALPVYNNGNQTVSCWKLSFMQRIKALFIGKIWLVIYSGENQPPVWMDCTNSIFLKVKK